MANQQHAGPPVHSQEGPPSGRHGDDDGARLPFTPAAHGRPTANVAGAYSSSILSGPASGTSAAIAGPVELGQQSTVPGDQALALARTTQDIERRLSVIEDAMKASPANNAIDPQLQPPPEFPTSIPAITISAPRRIHPAPPPAPSSEVVLDPLLPQNPPLAPPAAQQRQPSPETPRQQTAIPVFEGDDIVRIITPSTSNRSFPPPPSLAVRSSFTSVPADHLTLEEKLERDKQVLEAERTHWLELMNLSDGTTPNYGGALLPPPPPVPVPVPHPSVSAAAARNPILLPGGLEFVNDDQNRELLRQLIVTQREQNRKPPPPPYQSPYTYKEGMRARMQKIADQQKTLQQQQQQNVLDDLDQREKVLDQYEMLVGQQEELLNQYEMLVDQDQDPDQPLPSVEQQQGPAKEAGGESKGERKGKGRIIKQEGGWQEGGYQETKG
ncbi:hypothetical protein QBC46DRAFT_352610 [Diplogelasinospora grovesii]|uniref:Uncharacterized protein n=1 Tax=Diplogelasinospora grovesii TaxID=303347 RepID=A0AAN6S6D8_9PEZI|nr:hypothetical protein QBC46DRAFT_352610 [Diplogelasinospora grovesii]